VTVAEVSGTERGIDSEVRLGKRDGSPQIEWQTLSAPCTWRLGSRSHVRSRRNHCSDRRDKGHAEVI
jgi:hypothetical protein